MIPEGDTMPKHNPCAARFLRIRLSAVCLCAALILTSVGFPSPVFAEQQKTVEQLEARYNQIEDELKANEKKMADNVQNQSKQKDKIASLETEINSLNDQIGILDEKISLLNGDISQINSNIASLDAEIESVNAQITAAKIEIAMTENAIDETYEKVLERLALSYMMGDSSTLELLMGSKSLSDILTRQQYMQNAAQYDKDLIMGLEEDIDKLNEMNATLEAANIQVNHKKRDVEAQKQELQAKQASVQSSANDLAAKKSAVNVQRGNAVAMLKTLDKESAEYKQIQKQLQAEKEKVDREIDALIAAQGSSQGDEMDVEIKNDGTLIWPMPYPNCYISAYYPAYSDGSPHHGIDICVSGGTEGKNIVAAQSGKVITSGTGHWSMGNYIIIDHGNGLFTAYYHCSALLVSQGQMVKQGQVIARAGHTGNTTGPHLHFEVRVNKNGSVQRVNPLNYVSKP